MTRKDEEMPPSFKKTDLTTTSTPSSNVKCILLQDKDEGWVDGCCLWPDLGFGFLSISTMG